MYYIEELRKKVAKHHGPQQRMKPVHPGEILQHEFLDVFKMTQRRLATKLGVPPRRINEIVHGVRGISADTAVRLEKYFGISALFWMNLQAHYDVETERRHLGSKLNTIVERSW